jgi:hypothetical protein
VGFSLVESDHYTAAEFGILEPSQGKQCPFNPPDLPQCGRHRRLSRIAASFQLAKTHWRSLAGWFEMVGLGVARQHIEARDSERSVQV